MMDPDDEAGSVCLCRKQIRLFHADIMGVCTSTSTSNVSSWLPEEASFAQPKVAAPQNVSPQAILTHTPPYLVCNPNFHGLMKRNQGLRVMLHLL